MNHEVFASLLWVILGGVICLASVSLRLGSWHFPGPGLFPFLIGSTIALLSFGRGILVYFKTPSRFQFWPHSAGLKRILLLFACLMFSCGHAQASGVLGVHFPLLHRSFQRGCGKELEIQFFGEPGHFHSHVLDVLPFAQNQFAERLLRLVAHGST